MVLLFIHPSKQPPHPENDQLAKVLSSHKTSRKAGPAKRIQIRKSKMKTTKVFPSNKGRHLFPKAVLIKLVQTISPNRKSKKKPPAFPALQTRKPSAPAQNCTMRVAR